ncbi:MAG: right-handed parallel beta-helix repeat-containing protein, partial [Bacteroidota bacterium]
MFKGTFLKYFLFVFLSLILISCNKKATSIDTTFYLDSIHGDDSNDGRSPKRAWKSLEKANEHRFEPGTQLLLAKGSKFDGTLLLQGGGNKQQPVLVGAYEGITPSDELPIIDGKGYLAAVQITNGKYFKIQDLELTADAGTVQDSLALAKRYGVYIHANEQGDYPGIHLKNLFIHHIFSTLNPPGDGQNPTSNRGIGISFQMEEKGAKIRDVTIESCRIEMTGHTGIRISGARKYKDWDFLEGVTIINNRLKHIGGPGMVPGVCQNVIVRGNIVDHSGSSIDPRMHARGSGIWPWNSRNVLIENNQFLHARGKADSCGVHIDFYCRDVVVQYNLSMDNEGGFVEILGDVWNSTYRYNISINDGFRVKRENGAKQEGKVLWTSGYVGRKQKKHGPYNNYIYNNTVYVKSDLRSCFSFTGTTKGLLIANNIFDIEGITENVSGDQDRRIDDKSIALERVVFQNNLYTRTGILPASLSIKDEKPIIGSPNFVARGQLSPEAY